MKNSIDEIERRQKIEELKRKKLRARAEALNSRMMRKAEQLPIGDNMDVLQSHADLLDSAFRSFVAGADVACQPLPYYALALKAQNQYRQTAMALKTLKNKEIGDRKK